MTDPTGRSFLSYRRTRVAEATLLIRAQHDHGIPTWQDVADLESEPTPDELRRVLADPQTANVLLWTTGDVADSPTITCIEVPEAMKRKRANDGFFIQPVVAGGLGYADAAAIAGRYLGVDGLNRWNWARVEQDPIGKEQAARVARLILGRRLKEIDHRLDRDAPFRISLHTRRKAPLTPGIALTLDWSERFRGRCATEDVWRDMLFPALTVVADALYACNPSRPVQAHGLSSLAAAMGLGGVFLAPRGHTLSWRQTRAGRDDQIWSLEARREPAAIEIDRIEDDLGSADLALLVSINHDVEPAVRASARLPRFRGYVRVRGPSGREADLANPGEAADAAFRICEALRNSRSEWHGVRGIHVFFAGPAGLAVMLGQLVNGLGPIQTYEHIPGDAVGSYEPAVLLTPGCA